MSSTSPATAAAEADLAQTSASSTAEKSATSPPPTASAAKPPGGNAASNPSAPTPVASKARSCIICRRRKVRCDKQLPCGNCRRAGIACEVPASDRPPRWTRRLERYASNVNANANVNANGTYGQARGAHAGAVTDGRSSNGPSLSSQLAPQMNNPEAVDKVMDRLRSLEGLVKQLSGELEQARAATIPAASTAKASPASSASQREGSGGDHASPMTDSSGVSRPFGRLVVQDASRSHYVSSGFWSRIDDEIDGLKTDARDLAQDESDTSDEGNSSARAATDLDPQRTPEHRNAFLFRHNMDCSTVDVRSLHPLPSQVSYLIENFCESVNAIIHVVHEPSLTRIVREWRNSNMTNLTTSDEALLFSIYYAAVAAMEEADVTTNFGTSKSELSLKYRLGLEHTLAKADFLNCPDITLIQALTIFLFLARRHDSPRYVWMMTGLVIRMAQFLGLHRDGSNFKHLSPFEIETRRRVWWGLCALDVRTSEDQGTDVAIAYGSFDTRVPLNINETDIDPKIKHMPPERHEKTDMSFARISAAIAEITRKIMALSKDGSLSGVEEQNRLSNEIYERFDREFLQYSSPHEDGAYWVAEAIARLVMAKLTLIVFLPVLFSAPSADVSEEIRNKLLISAIEVAEYNHTLNDSQSHVCRQWRWVYQSHTHWHAVVYLMIEAARRPWSPIVERAWIALHSRWLMPARGGGPDSVKKNLRIWIPLRRLMEKARRHRDTELNRLRADPSAAARLEQDDQKFRTPASAGTFQSAEGIDVFRERWRQLVAPEGNFAGLGMQASVPDISVTPVTSNPSNSSTMYGVNSSSPLPNPTADANRARVSSSYFSSGFQQDHLNPNNTEPQNWSTRPSSVSASNINSTAAVPTFINGMMGSDPSLLSTWPGMSASVDMFPDLDLSALDVDMDIDADVNWYNWVESAKGIDLNLLPNGD